MIRDAPRCTAAPECLFEKPLLRYTGVDVETLEFLRTKVGADHLLLGTDFPYVLGDWMCVDKVEALPGSEMEKQLILEGNARKLLKISDVWTEGVFTGRSILVGRISNRVAPVKRYVQRIGFLVSSW